MKLLLVAFLTSFSVLATEYSAGMRESYFVPNNYFFGSDSSARIRKSLKNKGFNSFTLNTRLNIHRGSLIAHPRLKSSITNLETMISLVRFGNGSISIKPSLMSGEIEAPELTTAENTNHNILLASYQREMARYLSLSRKTDFDEMIIGSGVGTLYAHNFERLDSFHQYIRSSLSPATKMGLSLDSENLLSGMNENTLTSINENFDSISYNIGDASDLAIRLPRILSMHQAAMGNLEIKLSNVIIPSDRSISDIVDIINQYDIDGVELLMSTTDYEPDTIDTQYFYYRNESFLILSDAETLEVLPAISFPKMNKPLVCIFFDLKDTEDKKDRLGRIHSTVLESLLGAFPQYAVSRSDLGKYKAGDLNKCEKALYLATHFSAKIPADFLTDIATYMESHDFMWMNYKFSELKHPELKFEVPYVLLADKTPTREDHDIAFYQFFDYKGETFFKKKGWSLVSDNFLSSPEVHYINIEDKNQVEVLASARHNKTENVIPYIVKQKIKDGKIWYVGDSPFAFVHYEDRYLILTDILWDFLEVEAPAEPPKALVRIEDVNPSVQMPDLNWAMSYLYQENVPFSLALIPYYSDIVGATELNNYNPVFAPITKFPHMKASLKYAKALGADFVYHGVAHQVDEFISGYTGVSGSDYEFWIYPENTPVPYDSVDWVMDRLEKGEAVFNELDIRPSAWEIPHYAASVLDYKIFGKIFEWTYHRPVIFEHEILSDTDLPLEYGMFDCLTDKCRQERRALLRNIKVTADYADFGAALYPYPIQKDVYGQAIIPETLGMVDFAFYSPNTWRPVSNPKDILRRAKKLKVIRGAMASFFWHPQLLSDQARYYLEVPGSYEEMGGQNSLKTIVTGLKDLGYEFISISDCNHFPQKGCK